MTDNSMQVPAGLTTEGLLGKRYMARFIDGMLLGLVSLATVNLLAITPASENVLLSMAVLLVLWVGYGGLMESSSMQATLGKRMMGLRVYDAGGGRLSVRQAIARNLIKEGPFIVLAMIPFGQWFIILLLGAHLFVIHRSPVYQAIHDRIVKTWVAAPETTTQLHLA